MVAITLFIGPRHGGDEPDMSKVSVSPRFVIRIAIRSGSSTTPSESTNASPS